MPFAVQSEAMLIKYPNSPWDGPIPYTIEDFIVIEDVRDLLPSFMLPPHETDFLLVCRDNTVSSSQYYGIRIHKSIFWQKGSSGIRASLEKAPKVRTSTSAAKELSKSHTTMIASADSPSGHGFSFHHRPLCVLHATISFMYTGSLCYDIDKLPFSEAYFLVYLYISAVNRGLTSLADAAYSRIRHPQTRINDNKDDMRSVLSLILYSQLGKEAAGNKRTTEIREVVLEQFAAPLLEILDEEDLCQFCGDNSDFRDMLLQARSQR